MKIYIHVFHTGGVHRRETRVKLTIRHKKHGKHSSPIRISRAAGRTENKKIYPPSLSPPFHHVKAIWRTEAKERN